MDEIKKVSKKSLAKILALIYALVGFLFTISIAISTLIDSFISQGNHFLTQKIIFDGTAGLIVTAGVTLFLSVFGYLMGYFIASIYNIFTARMGGIKLEIGPEKEKEVKVETKEEVREEVLEKEVVKKVEEVADGKTAEEEKTVAEENKNEEEKKKDVYDF
jgi:hypothetical protein